MANSLNARHAAAIFAFVCAVACESSTMKADPPKMSRKSSDACDASAAATTSDCTTDTDTATETLSNSDTGTGTGTGTGTDAPVTVDCSVSTATGCKQLVQDRLTATGASGIRINVQGCTDDDQTSCSDIDQLGSTSDQVTLDSSTSTDSDSDSTTVTSTADSIDMKAKDIVLGVGGPNKPYYFFRSSEREQALECAHAIQTASDSNPNAKNCKTGIEIGSVKFSGSSADGEQSVSATDSTQCICSNTITPPVSGLSWSGSLTAADSFSP